MVSMESYCRYPGGAEDGEVGGGGVDLPLQQGGQPAQAAHPAIK